MLDSETLKTHNLLETFNTARVRHQQVLHRSTSKHDASSYPIVPGTFDAVWYGSMRYIYIYMYFHMVARLSYLKPRQRKHGPGLPSALSLSWAYPPPWCSSSLLVKVTVGAGQYPGRGQQTIDREATPEAENRQSLAITALISS